MRRLRAGEQETQVAEDHWSELVGSRVLAGVLGALGLLLLWWLRRRTALGRPEWTPPEGTVAVPLAWWARRRTTRRTTR